MALRPSGQHARLAAGQPRERLLLPGRQAGLPPHGTAGRVAVQGRPEVPRLRLVAPLHVRRPGQLAKAVHSYKIIIAATDLRY